MPRVDLALVEWPEDLSLGGPRLLGRIADPDLVELVRERIAAHRRRELARLGPPVRLVGEDPEDGE
jgi:hypothetical protein